MSTRRQDADEHEEPASPPVLPVASPPRGAPLHARVPESPPDIALRELYFDDAKRTPESARRTARREIWRGSPTARVVPPRSDSDQAEIDHLLQQLEGWVLRGGLRDRPR